MHKIRVVGNQKPEYRNQKIFFIWLLVTGYWLLSANLSLAEDFTYSSKGKRDPFVSLVGPGAIYQVKEAVEINSIGDVSLEGIIYDEKGGSRVIINGMVLKEGDQLGVVIVDKIEPKKAILLIGENRHEVTLEQGKGGE